MVNRTRDFPACSAVPPRTAPPQSSTEWSHVSVQLCAFVTRTGSSALYVCFYLQYGLYSALAGAVVYVVFGTCKEVNIGPTALISLLTYTYTHDTSPDMAVLLCFLTGCVVLLCGILHLGQYKRIHCTCLQSALNIDIFKVWSDNLIIN